MALAIGHRMNLDTIIRAVDNRDLAVIAVNWLLQDHRDSGPESILHRVLAALNA